MPISRTRRAISWLYWPPKSKIKTISCAKKSPTFLLFIFSLCWGWMKFPRLRGKIADKLILYIINRKRRFVNRGNNFLRKEQFFPGTVLFFKTKFPVLRRQAGFLSLSLQGLNEAGRRGGCEEPSQNLVKPHKTSKRAGKRRVKPENSSYFH